MTFRRKEGKLSEWVLSGMQIEKEQQIKSYYIVVSCFLINLNC